MRSAAPARRDRHPSGTARLSARGSALARHALAVALLATIPTVVTATAGATGGTGGIGLPAALGAPVDRPANQPAPSEEPPPPEPSKPPKPPKPPPDTAAPAPPDLGDPEIQPGGRITLAFAAEDRSLVVATELTAAGEEQVARRRADGQAQELTWTAESGERTYTVTATDRAGNESQPATVTLEVDADPPVVRRFEATPGTARNPLSTVELVTEPATTYSLSVDGEQVAAGTTGVNGREVIEQTLDLGDGRYPVEVELTDEAGNRTEDFQVLVVAVGDLFVRARLTTGPTDPLQVVEIRATPGSAGRLRVAGERATPFDVAEDGTARVRLDLADGEYDGALVTVEDANDRRGSAELTDFTVDTTGPALELAAVGGAAEQGRLRFEVTAEEGYEVDWRVLDTAGRVVTLGTFIAVAEPEIVERDLDEGSYTVQATTSDIFERTAEQEITVGVAADPLSPRTLAFAGLVLLVVLLALALVARRLWRRRRERATARRALGPAVAAQDDRGAYERAEAAWVDQHQALTRLAAVARGDVPDDPDLPPGFVLLPEETALWCADGRLLDGVDGVDGVDGSTGSSSSGSTRGAGSSPDGSS